MKINNPDSAALSGTGRAAETSAVSTSAGSRKSAGSSSDSVDISSLGDHLRALLSDSPERTARVAQLESAVSSGRYRPDANAVSNSIIQGSMAAGAAG